MINTHLIYDYVLFLFSVYDESQMMKGNYFIQNEKKIYISVIKCLLVLINL